MTTYNTGNPVGSPAPQDLYDNAENFDVLSTSTTLESHPDRLGVPRKTLHGMQVEFDAALDGWADDVNTIVIAGGQIFPDEATGRAEVADGQYYYAESSDPA